MERHDRSKTVRPLLDAIRMAYDGWRPMALYCLLVWAVTTVILTPLATWILHRLATYNDVIVGNYSIHRWLMTPQGVLYLMLGGIGLLASSILQVAGMFRIADRGLVSAGSSWGVLRELSGSAVDLARLSLFLLGICLAGFVLLAIGPGLAFLFLLTGHDINYYLTHHPPQWYAALTLGGLWVVPLGAGMFFLAVRYLYLVPAWLDGLRPISAALRMSRTKTAPTARYLFGLMVAWVAIWFLIGAAGEIAIFWLSGSVLARVASLNTVVLVICGTLFLSTLFSIVLGFAAMAWGVSLWVVCYRRDVRGEAREDQSPRPMQPVAALVRLLQPRIMLPMLAVLLASSFGASAWLLNKQVPQGVPIVVAHRAGAALAPENSLAAMRRTLDDGVTDIVEVDVTLTGDGELVVAHDRDLMKQAGDRRVIGETSFADLQTADIGIGFGPDFAGERLAPLSGFLELASDRVPLILEFKHGSGTPLVEKTVEAVRRHGMAEQVILMSLELDEVRMVEKLAPDIRVGYFASVEMGDVSRVGVDVLGAKESMVNAAFMKRAREEGMAVYVWTVDDRLRMLELIEAGVDGIITNDPLLAADLIRRVEVLPPSLRMLLQFRGFWEILSDLGWWKSGKNEVNDSDG